MALQSGEVVGPEASSRGVHPVWDQVSPLKWMALAEEGDLMTQLDAGVVHARRAGAHHVITVQL
ncbi:hypothetical protein M1R55_21140 (plasmid) [Deinococcus sp. QL22]|nr:hypothetical protein M1R55_21140 [Deinococcus sp. QL22]